MACGEPRLRMAKVCAFVFSTSAQTMSNDIMNGNDAQNLITPINTMKKLIVMILLAVVMVGCNSDRKIWLFTLGQSKEKVEQILKDNNYRYKINKEDRDGFEGTQVVEFMGVKWDGFMLTFEDNKLNQISFRKADGTSVSEEEAETLVKEVDKKMGEHREDRTALRTLGCIGWEWRNGDVEASYSWLFNGSMSLLTFFEKKDSDNKESTEEDNPTVEEVMVVEEAVDE